MAYNEGVKIGGCEYMYGTTILKGIGLLPATGESQNYFFLGLGIVVLLVAVALIINYVRKNRG